MAKRNSKSTATPRFETTVWQTADKLRGNLEAAEYKQAILDGSWIIARKALGSAKDLFHAYLLVQRIFMAKLAHCASAVGIPHFTEHFFFGLPVAALAGTMIHMIQLLSGRPGEAFHFRHFRPTIVVRAEI